MTTGSDGNFYGTTWHGGSNADGTVFRLLLPPTITLEPHSQTNGAGATVTFRVGATSLNPMGYQWQKNGTNLANGGNMSGETTNTLSITGISDSDSGTYTVILTNLYGITVSSNAVLEVLDLPFIVTQPLSQTVDLGGSVTFSAQANGVPPFVFEWCFNGTPVASSAPGTNYSAYTLTNIRANQAGNYSVVVVNEYGSLTSSNALLTVIVPPSLVLEFVASYPLLNLNGMLRSNFVVQYSTNLAGTNWINLLSLTNLQDSPYLFLDPAGDGEPARFYRAFMQ